MSSFSDFIEAKKAPTLSPPLPFLPCFSQMTHDQYIIGASLCNARRKDKGTYHIFVRAKTSPRLFSIFFKFSWKIKLLKIKICWWPPQIERDDGRGLQGRTSHCSLGGGSTGFAGGLSFTPHALAPPRCLATSAPPLHLALLSCFPDV